MNELWPNVVYIQYPLPLCPPIFLGGGGRVMSGPYIETLQAWRSFLMHEVGLK